jgi:hypothetical protein
MTQPTAELKPKQPPKLPTQESHALMRLNASRHQRIRAGLIDHFIDSTVWVWLFSITLWNTLHLQDSIDARPFFIILCSSFSTSIALIGLLFIGDFLLCVYRGQSLGQMINGIYKVIQPLQSNRIKHHLLDFLRLWLHGLISRCLGLPLLFICLLLWLGIDPTITPIHLNEFSLIEPQGSYLLMIDLLKIIGITLFLFGLFLPAGLAFTRGTLPTWYDRLLGVFVLQITLRSNN